MGEEYSMLCPPSRFSRFVHCFFVCAIIMKMAHFFHCCVSVLLPSRNTLLSAQHDIFLPRVIVCVYDLIPSLYVV